MYTPRSPLPFPLPILTLAPTHNVPYYALFVALWGICQTKQSIDNQQNNATHTPKAMKKTHHTKWGNCPLRAASHPLPTLALILGIPKDCCYGKLPMNILRRKKFTNDDFGVCLQKNNRVFVFVRDAFITQQGSFRVPADSISFPGIR